MKTIIMTYKRKNALSVSRDENFAEWYLAAISGADLAENSGVRGCIVIKPYGYAIWERIQNIIDKKIKELGHLNCYFPMFIPVDLFEKEAIHVAGFAKEMAIVTHTKLEMKDGKMVPTSALETPLVVRPTSEMIVGESFARWIKSYRNLPILINQWCNIVRWEMRTRMFLRSSEFLWQEGHTAHETSEEALQEASIMHDVYHWFMRDVLKMFAIAGEKPNHEKFPGAEKTFSIELMMQDGKALQAATSHYLGTGFARAANIKFQGRDGAEKYVYTTSWGMTTRLIGAVVMSHGDDDGINLPSAIAPYHVVIVPIVKNGEYADEIVAYCDKIKNSCPVNVRVMIDKKDYSPQHKKWDYVRKGVPFICEIGKKEIADEQVVYTKRADNLQKVSVSLVEFAEKIEYELDCHDDLLQQKNNNICKQKMISDVSSFDEMLEIFRDHNNVFVLGKIFVDSDGNITEEVIKLLQENNLSIRCFPTEQIDTVDRCIFSDREASVDAIIAKAY